LFPLVSALSGINRDKKIKKIYASKYMNEHECAKGGRPGDGMVLRVLAIVAIIGCTVPFDLRVEKGDIPL
jgi:hypothetical protein